MDEGYIKFHCNWIEAGPISINQFHDINKWRDTLYNLGLIGAYGTTEMANEIKRLFIEANVKAEKIIAMAGHKEGLIAFGKTLDEAGEILLKRV